MSQEERPLSTTGSDTPEYILPLYPGILLASTVSSIPLYNLMKANIVYRLCL
jgi:hypothetical protein